LPNLAGLTQSTLQSILSNKNLPAVPALEKICDALDISLSAFLNRLIILMKNNQFTSMICWHRSLRRLSKVPEMKLNEFIKSIK